MATRRRGNRPLDARLPRELVVAASARGQPWLVNALARQAPRDLVPGRAQPIGREVVESAKEILIQRRDTHLDALIERLREPRVRRVVEAILAGQLLPTDVLDVDIASSRTWAWSARSRKGWRSPIRSTGRSCRAR